MRVTKLGQYQVKPLRQNATLQKSSNCHFDALYYQVTKDHLSVSPDELVWRGWLIHATSDNKLILHLVDTASKNLDEILRLTGNLLEGTHIHTAFTSQDPTIAISFDGSVVMKRNDEYIQRKIHTNDPNAKVLRHVRINQFGGVFICENGSTPVLYRCTDNNECRKAALVYANGCNVYFGPQLDRNKVIHKYFMTDNRWFAGIYYTDTFSHFGFRSDFEIVPDFSSYQNQNKYFTRFGVILSSSEFAVVTKPLLQIKHDSGLIKIHAEKFKITSNLGKPLHFMHDLIVFEKAIYSTYYDRGLIFENDKVVNAFRNGRFYIVNLQSNRDLIMTLFTFASIQIGKSYEFGSIKAKVFNLYDLRNGFAEVEIYAESFADSEVSSDCQCTSMS